MCAPASPPAPAFYGVCAEAARQGLCTRLELEAAELRSGHADCPPVRSPGKVAPGAVSARPRCDSFRKRRHDRVLQGPYAFLPIPAERSRGLNSSIETAGEAPENGRNPARVGDFPRTFTAWVWVR